MREIEQIRNHPLYRKYYTLLEKEEQGRMFCCHQMNHLLDVARIAYIWNLERNLGIRKEVIYAAALLHDIGKYRQYAAGIPHERASAEIAEIILKDQGDDFTEEEQRAIISAISKHREICENMTVLDRLLYDSDKKSRTCYSCAAEKECDWSMEKKNMETEI